MKKVLLGMLLIFCAYANAQDFSKLSEIKLAEKEDYEVVEDKVLDCSNYIINTPIGDDANRLKATQFVLRWMSGSPDFSFNLDETLAKILNSDQELFGVYLACMAKYVLENEQNASDYVDVKFHSISMLLEYCEDPNNKVTVKKDLKKMIVAKNNGELEKHL